MPFFRLAIVSLLLSLVASNVHAYAIHYATSPLEGLATNDTVTVDLYLDAEPGLQLLSIGVLWQTSRLAFQPLASTTASYVLYTPSPPPGQAGWLAPPRDPWVEWPGNKPAGFSQLNVDFTTAPLTFFPAAGSGTNVWLTSLVFHVIDGAGAPPIIEVTLEAGGNVIMSNDVVLDPASVPITLIPEPSTGLLLVEGLAAATLLRRGRRSRARS